MRIERHGAGRTALLPLFALADDSPAQVATYIALGEVFVAQEIPRNSPTCAVASGSDQRRRRARRLG
jgi:hypothetical protein